MICSANIQYEFVHSIVRRCWSPKIKRCRGDQSRAGNNTSTIVIAERNIRDLRIRSRGDSYVPRSWPSCRLVQCEIAVSSLSEIEGRRPEVPGDQASLGIGGNETQANAKCSHEKLSVASVHDALLNTEPPRVGQHRVHMRRRRLRSAKSTLTLGQAFAVDFGQDSLFQGR